MASPGLRRAVPTCAGAVNRCRFETAAGCGRLQVRVNDVYREVLPFFWALLGVLALVTYLPRISLWLPRLIGY